MYQDGLLGDVGQGDAALLITPHGHGIMFDTGGLRTGSFDVGARVDVPYMLHYGIRELDYIFLTHAHDDHAGGVKGIIPKLPVKPNPQEVRHLYRWRMNAGVANLRK